MSHDHSNAGDPLDGIAETLNRMMSAATGQMTGGLSPVTLIQSMSDWALHLATAPGRQMQLGARAAHNALRLGSYIASSANADREPAIQPLPQDHRFGDPAWKEPPFDLISQGFLLTQQWWHAATTGIGGVSRHHEAVVSFVARQLLDMLAPSNFIATNPVLQQRIAETDGRCLIEGTQLFVEDLLRLAQGQPEAGVEAYQAGKEVAVTPGKVVFRNELIELIQYSPTTEKVRAEPILIVPAWIMKYYILDLSPRDSLVRWLVDQGYTVFMISWHNPDAADRNLDMEDYRLKGPMAALDAVTAITGAQKVHCAGYCLGGTLLSIAAATMARDGDDRIASLTLLASQTDFTEPGEIGLFIDDSQLNLLDGIMWNSGYLGTARMGGAFQMLRSNDLIWSRILTTYLMGERPLVTDLVAWNADGTRMPYAMHSQYLRQLFLENDLAGGHYRVGAHTISLSALRAPMFVVGTEHDHIAPWRSVYKIHMLTGAQITFALASSGHNTGIVSEPGHPRRRYRIATRPEDGAALDVEEWADSAQPRDGSWWLAWKDWLDGHSGEPVDPPPMGAPDRGYAPIENAPGRYVMER
ncbi:alpha/beta fold hydrolase [Stakelama sp. CBK3Z-3]|uniref:Alpha/beta fold hydrolase n=1 Tax=Stakelama flava TaxID=2860338 RepID=A0ABS6XJ53_9SPHN|nr:alpha/beta fold hydrolase [Stakelama flava]MBW4330221.1 alpha/beta fold hydrolase [Stakelama flava]